MNKYPLSCFLVALSGLMANSMAHPAVAANTNANSVVMTTSAEVHGLRVFVFSDSHGAPASVDDPVNFGFTSSNSFPASILVPNEIEAICRADLLDEQGIPVERTAYGKKFGSHFFSAPDKPKMNRVRRTVTVGVFPLPSPRQLFQIQKPAEYKLRIQFQLYSKTDSTQVSLIRFPVVELLVVARSGADRKVESK